VLSVHFAHPLVLLLLVLVPLLLWWWRRWRRSALRFPQATLLRRLPAGRSAWVRRLGLVCRALGLICLIVALAGPRWPDIGSRIPTEGIAIAIVLDVSGSMAEKDFDWQGKKISRLEAAKEVFKLFVRGGIGPDGQQFSGRDNDLISLVVFATRPETACPLTLSHGVLEKILEEQQPRRVPTEARTNIGDALAWALNGLNRAGHVRKVMVLLSDGEHNVPPKALKPRQAAQLAGHFGVPIHVIDAGKEGSESSVIEEEKVNRDRAQTILKEVASITRGQYFQAGDTRALLQVCEQIDALERQQILSFQYRHYYEGFVWFALAAFVFFFSIHLLESTVWRRWP
jgi:Ca-activated chloride channel family protein